MFDLFASAISFFYQLTHSFGGAIILLTILVRLLMFPLTAKQARSMQAMQRVQPEIKRLQQKYKDDRQKLNEELMKFYRENQINPAAGCLPLLIQMPIFFVLFRVIRGLTHATGLSWLGIRVPQPQYLDASSEMYRALVNAGGQMKSWGVDLALAPREAMSDSFAKGLPYLFLVAMVAVTGLYQQRQSMARTKGQPQNAQAQQMQMILKFMPLIFAFVAFSMQAGLVLYFVVSNLWTIGQQAIIFHQLGPIPTDDTVIEASAREKGSKVKGDAAISAAAVKPAPPVKAGKGYTPPRAALPPTGDGAAKDRSPGTSAGSAVSKGAPKPAAPAKPASTAPRPGQGQRKKKGK